MLDVEGSKLLVQAHCRGANEGVQQTKVVAEPKGRRVYIGTLTIGNAWPLQAEALKLFLESLRLR
jgi:hypothetical protein